MATKRGQEIQDFVAHDGNESFNHFERECPKCGISRKALALACFNDNFEDRCAAGSVAGSCPDCREAMVSLEDELRRREVRRQYW